MTAGDNSLPEGKSTASPPMDINELADFIAAFNESTAQLRRVTTVSAPEPMNWQASCRSRM